MNIEEALVTYLNAQAGLAAVQNAIAPWPLPQLPTLPRVTYHRIDLNVIGAHDGDSNLHWGRFQLDAWATDYATAHSLGEALVTALSWVRGTWGTLPVGLSQVVNAFDTYEPQLGYHRFTVEVMIWRTPH